jgi:hypothetical protein
MTHSLAAIHLLALLSRQQVLVNGCDVFERLAQLWHTGNTRLVPPPGGGQTGELSRKRPRSTRSDRAPQAGTGAAALKPDA